MGEGAVKKVCELLAHIRPPAKILIDEGGDRIQKGNSMLLGQEGR
jgi:hypothetical protein